MSIVYSLIAKEKTNVLVSFSPIESNVQGVTLELLEKLQPLPICSITDADKYAFHIIMDEGFTYVCVVESLYPQQLAFKFLNDVKEAFIKQFTLYERQNAISHAFDSSFKDFLKNKIREYNTNPDGIDQLRKLKNNVSEITTIIHKNIDEVLKREQIIEKAVMKTTKMNESALHIKKQATQARRDAYWRSMRIKIFIAVIILAFIITAFIML